MAFKFGNLEVFPHTLNFDFMRFRFVSLTISVLLILFSIAVIAVKGINYSIDFLGGAEINVSVNDASLTRDKVDAAAQKANVGKVDVTTIGAVGSTAGLSDQQSFMLRIQREKGTEENVTTGRAETLVKALETEFGPEKVKVGSITNISGKVGDEEQIRGYMSVLISFVIILLYVGIRFDSRFAPGAVICLFHDVIIALGIMTFLGRPFSVASIAAFLTIVGYSCNDTIIIYDRIREYQANFPRMPIIDVINKSINQTMNRTVLTSTTTLIALVILIFLGGGAIEDFALTMFIGILIGTFSSIYVAAPITIIMDDFMVSRGWRAKEPKQKAKVAKDPNYIPPVVLKRKPEKK